MPLLTTFGSISVNNYEFNILGSRRSYPSTETNELTSSNGAANNYFGTYVDFDSTGTIAIVGAYTKTIGSNTNRGAAYIFTNSGGTWSQASELLASDGATGDTFGYPVVLNDTGTIALIGANNKNSSQGAAYVFTNSNGSWSQTTELIASDGVAGDSFGGSIAINSSGNITIIGARNKNNKQGAVYIFD